jgi:hypothetical protein
MLYITFESLHNSQPFLLSPRGRLIRVNYLSICGALVLASLDFLLAETQATTSLAVPQTPICLILYGSKSSSQSIAEVAPRNSEITNT